MVKNKEKVFTSPIRIGNKEYIIKPLSMLDVKKIRAIKEKEKMEDYDYNFYCLLYVLKKFNQDCKMSVEEFEDIIDADKYEEIQEAIMDISGLEKLFKMGDKKK